jgi:hypothetical protein
MAIAVKLVILLATFIVGKPLDKFKQQLMVINA